MLYLKFDVLEKLKEAGYTSYKIRVDNLFGSRTVQDLRNGIVPGIKTINTICSLLKCQPGDVIGFSEDGETAEK